MQPFNLSGRTALITGGSAGIGLSLARQLLDRGVAQLIIVGRDERRLSHAAAELGPNVIGLAADLSDTMAAERLVGEAANRAPDLSLVINNAGMQRLTDFTADVAHETYQGLRAEIGANFTAVVTLSIGLLAVLARQRSAAIVNVTSGLALAPKKSAPVYCATKAGVRSFTQALRYQCADALPHIRIVEALPPLVDTAMTHGRGRGKMSADACAKEIVAGLIVGRSEIYVGKSKLLRSIMGVAPALGRRIMRDG